MSDSKMNKLKLQSHQKNYREEDLLVNVKDLGPDVKESDVVEIYHPEDDLPRLLLQIPSTKDDVTVQKDTISIEQSIASTFQLRVYKDVIVNKVDPKAVALELVELTFKDQYLGRSEMWRIKKNLVNSVMYINKKLEFCAGSIRCQVYEMWAQGEKVACGVVTEDTKIVYRSSTSMVYLFIQMSSEMWDFDIYGDLYFEKAVNGFLSELFAKWKKEGSNHDVTIVLFSRTYYKASSIDDFPACMRECLQEDYKGRFYEDFYRVAVQNERYDDWSPILTHLRQLFNSYLTKVLDHHRQQDVFVPEATNSCASQGNFLEVLNISLNVFDKHYLDRSFDRTGQMSVVITPGVGVFEVDRELTNITKQRIIDNGVGSDLVCVGEQPLHAVPLLKFHNKKGSINADDYSMPHTWINLSFYSTNKKVGYGTFVPRIKLPPERPKTAKKEKMDVFNKQHIQHTALPNSIFDYDAYDAQVFKLPTNQNNKTYRSLQRTAARKKNNSQSASMQPLTRINLQRKLSDPDLYHSVEQISGSMVALGSSVSSVFDKSPAINIPARITENKTYSQSFGALNVEAIPGVNRPRTQTLYEGEELSPPQSVRVGSSAGASPSEPSQGFTQTKPTIVHRPGRSLINPFDPSHVTIKLTSNRRRWIHIFPKDPTGVLIQQHHYQASKDCTKENESSSSVTPPEVELNHVSGPLSSTPTSAASGVGTPIRPKTITSQLSQESISNGRRDNRTRTSSLAGSVTSVDLSVRGVTTPQKTNTSLRTVPGGTIGKDKHHATLLWGATGEQEWTAGLTTGVDWKSLCLPACLPITTDYFPEDRSLHNDYVVADYNLLPEDMNEHARGRKTLDTTQVFLELVSQRLAQGFQMIVRPVKVNTQAAVAIGNSPRYAGVGSLMRTRSRTEETSQEYRLSIGRMFHKIRLCGSTITVTIYRPRHPYPQLKRQYKYRFQAPDMSSYEVSWVEFRTERLETYMWNHLDNYICFRGESPDYPLIEPLKFWRFRVLLVPDCYRMSTKTIMDSPTGTYSDIYNSLTLEEQQTTIEGFLRFLEITVHRLKRPVSARKSRKKLISQENAAAFRERLGSNRVLERPRPRSGGKTSERMRMESGSREMHSDAPEMKSLLEPEEENKEEGENKKVNLSSPLTEIVEMMRDPVKGVGLLNRQAGLPALTFIAADATTWICEHVEGASSEVMAVDLLQKILKKELICHASGDRQHPFVHGFFLYFFVTGNKEQDQVLYETSTYSTEWHEVEVEPLSTKPGGAPSVPRPSSPCPTFLQPELPTYIPWKGRYSLYRIGLLDIDINNRSDRIEWGHIKHHSLFSPLQAFELITQWLCATGSVVADLMMSWQRKAVTCGLHLYPVPSDPFALPYSYISDPLRGPILIPLNVACLSGSGEPFVQFTSSTWGRRMHLFQEAILEKFGFVPYVTEAHSSEQNQYVHVTGNMFIMIHSPGTGVHSHLPYPPEVSRGRTSTTPVTPTTFPQADYLYGVSSPHVEYFHRLIADLYSREISEKQPGFLWSFNYMLTRRWKSSVSGDEALGEKMLHDFRQFCTNHHGRLRDFWDSHLPMLSPVSPADELIAES
ncbi:GATOR complex protein Iml1-like isoform X4 [Penaeus japonicus]|uniref:GATOR complex protein Iml1-like isoform X4 n=1 Tax=Penaeus japonicus TaxID=27405 RepID=UPI001C7124D1|nr:GATOR complex protein Iml1-like isoform X4 [Penaeus japonicus]